MILSRTYDTDAKARIAAYEAELQVNASDVDWLAEPETSVKITVRASGKSHPAWLHSRYGVTIACSCPGSQNGRLANAARKIADGWERATCCN